MPSIGKKASKEWGLFLLVTLFLQICAWSYEAYFVGSPVNSVLFSIFGQSDNFVILIDKIITASLLLSFTLFLITRFAGFLLVHVIYAIIIPICTYTLHSSFAYEFAFLGNAARIGLPLALYLFYKGEGVWSFEKRFLIRLSVCLTFVGHGIECMLEHPKFIDFLIEGFSILFAYDLSEGTAVQILALIGAADIVLGVSGLIKPRLWIYTWMTAWGFITAACRIMYFEWNGIFPALLRTSHWVLPAFLVWAILEKRKAAEPWKTWKTAKG